MKFSVASLALSAAVNSAAAKNELERATPNAATNSNKLLVHETVVDIAKKMDERNDALEAEGADFRVYYADVYTNDNQGTTVLSNIAVNLLAKDVGNKKLDNRFVPGDERRQFWNSDPDETITYSANDWMHFPGWDSFNTAVDDALEEAMTEWDDIECFHKVSLMENDPIPGNLPVYFGGLPTADIMHAGFVFIFNFNILAVHLDALFIDSSTSLPTDVDNNGYYDKAFGENFYNWFWPWDVQGNPDWICFKCVALHEAGHGLALAHFGKVTYNPKKDELKASPRAVMNGAYIEPALQELQTTDQAGICGLYAKWPNS